MSERFLFCFAVAMWLLMAIGFSDNWLFDIHQQSNSSPKFLVHAFFSFLWFTLLVTQSGLVRTDRVATHRRLGITAFSAYVLMTITIWALYAEIFLRTGDISMLIKPLEVLSVVLVVSGFAVRKSNRFRHREYIVFGTFCLIGPALDRTAFHLFGPQGFFYAMLFFYLLLFGSFAWWKRGLTWYMGLWLLGIAYSLYPMLAEQF